MSEIELLERGGKKRKRKKPLTRVNLWPLLQLNCWFQKYTLTTCITLHNRHTEYFSITWQKCLLFYICATQDWALMACHTRGAGSYSKRSDTWFLFFFSIFLFPHTIHLHKGSVGFFFFFLSWRLHWCDVAWANASLGVRLYIRELKSCMFFLHVVR